jgi:hypothetical protein
VKWIFKTAGFPTNYNLGLRDDGVVVWRQIDTNFPAK